MKKNYLKIILVFISIFFISTKVYASNIYLLNQDVPANLYQYDVANYGDQYYNFTFNFKITDNPVETGTPSQVNAVVYFEADINGKSVDLSSAILKSGDGEIPAKTKDNNRIMYVTNIIAADYKGKTIERTVKIPMALFSSITKQNNVPLNWKIYNGDNYSEGYASGTIKLADDPVSVTPKIGDTKGSTKYKLLAPIGNITCMDSSGLDKDCIGNNIGTYLNFIFKFAIGLCAALAVLMIIMNGIRYMGDESIFGKTEAKSKIFGAIGGLLIALAAWAILNTINPDLTGSKGVNVDSVSIQVTPLYDRGYNDPKKANGESIRCTPLTSGPCSVANLTTIFGAENAEAMSKICNMESGGTSAISGTDVCKPGETAFSFGLFQVNLSANGALAGSDCVGLFNKSVTGSDAIEPKYTSGYTCNLITGKESLYNMCKNRLLDTTTNLAIAKKLFTSDKNAWRGDKKYCASAFN